MSDQPTVASTYPHVEMGDLGSDIEWEQPPAFHVYEALVQDERSKPHHIASCHGDSLAFTLQTLQEEGQIVQSSKVGIMYRPALEETGVWLVNPWAKGRKK